MGQRNGDGRHVHAFFLLPDARDGEIFLFLKMTSITHSKKKSSAASPADRYRDRKGYDAGFIRTNDFKITLSGLLKKQRASLAPLLHPVSRNQYLLHYHHFSVAMHKERHMPMLTAVNIDGNQLVDYGRERDKWVYDPRISKNFQTPLRVYKNNDLDLGHLVRRLDPVWGNKARAANDDTFHVTVCAPQHKDLNRKTWLHLEDYILKNTQVEGLKVSVFTGAVFSDQDIPYDGVKLPLRFFKIAAVIKKDGRPSVSGYMLSQEEHIDDMAGERGVIADTGFGQYKTFQVPLSTIAKMTGLNLKPYYAFDPLNNADSRSLLNDRLEVSAETDIVL